MSEANIAVVQQPIPAGNVVVVEMQQSDAEFGGTMQIDAFESKFEHAVGKEKLAVAKDGCILELSTRPSNGFQNTFIAWVGDERAGFMSLKYHGVKDVYGDTSYPGIGCWSGLRLMCVECALGNEKVPAGKCYLEMICVDSKFRGRGVGKVLMEKADSEARKHDCGIIYLNVIGGNRAKNLYERQGFKVVDTTSSCLVSCAAGVDEVITMEKSLES